MHSSFKTEAHFESDWKMRRADRELCALGKDLASMKETKTRSQNYCAHRLAEREMTLEKRSHHVCTFSNSNCSFWKRAGFARCHSPQRARWHLTDMRWYLNTTRTEPFNSASSTVKRTATWPLQLYGKWWAAKTGQELSCEGPSCPSFNVPSASLTQCRSHPATWHDPTAVALPHASRGTQTN